MYVLKSSIGIFAIRSFRAEARQRRAEVEKSAFISDFNPDFSAPFAALTPVEMTSFLQGEIKTHRYGGRPFASDERRATSHGFTLAELLVALVVSSLILTTVATLAFALSRANDATDDTSRKQAEVRFATLRVLELIRQCRLICGTPGGELALWRADDNSDGQININELVYIERGTGKNYLRLCEFPRSDTSIVPLAAVATLSPNGYSVTRVTLIPQCSKVEFLLDVVPPRTKFVSISFDLAEDGVTRHYQINSAVRGWAGNLLSADGQSVLSDDD